MIHLRPYQNDLISKARLLMKAGCRSILIESPTGSGKTLLTAHMLKTCAERKQRAFFVVHRRELIKQSVRAFAETGVHAGVISAGWLEERQYPIQIASIQTLIRRNHKYAKPNLVVWDECHHLGAKSWAELHERYAEAYHIGLTATPCRLDGKGLGTFFKAMLSGPSVEWLIQNNFLSPYRMYAPSSVSTIGVHTRMGDFVQAEVTPLVDRPTITGSAVEHYRRLCPGKRALVFGVSVTHSQRVAAQFLAAGYNALHVDGDTPQEVRDEAVRKFQEGRLQILSNVELFGEGFDVPGTEAVILLRPTQSLGLYLQQIGRALRPSLDKPHAIILDHVGNVGRHGLPDEVRAWSLENGARQARDATSGPAVKICPSCMAAQFSSAPVCKFCGYAFEKKPREVAQVDGELKEVDPNEIRRRRVLEQAGAHDLESLYRLGVSRGYKHPRAWSFHVFQARQRAKLNKEAV